MDSSKHSCVFYSSSHVTSKCRHFQEDIQLWRAVTGIMRPVFEWKMTIKERCCILTLATLRLYQDGKAYQEDKILIMSSKIYDMHHSSGLNWFYSNLSTDRFPNITTRSGPRLYNGCTQLEKVTDGPRVVACRCNNHTKLRLHVHLLRRRIEIKSSLINRLKEK